MNGEGDDPIVIVHVGTNNINKCTTGKLMNKYEAMIEKFNVKCPKATLIISGILDRRDKWFYGNRIYKANQALHTSPQKACSNPIFLFHQSIAPIDAQPLLKIQQNLTVF